MTNALIVLIVALAFLLIGFLWGKGKQREESFKETKRAIEGQRATIKGKVAENVTPLLPDFEKQFPNLNITDARFIGEPIDYLFSRG